MNRRILFCDSVDTKDVYPFPSAAFAYLATAINHAFGAGVWEMEVATEKHAKRMDQYQPDLVAISSMTPNWPRAVAIARQAAVRGIPVVVGGVHITAMPHLLTRDMNVGVIGEGENTIIDLLCILMSEKGFTLEELRRINGICYVDERGAIQINDPNPTIMPLDSVGPPRFDLISKEGEPYVLTARGCPYRCIFCSSSNYWRHYRAHSPVYTISLIESAAKHWGKNHIWIMDDLFMADMDRLREIVRLARDRHFHERFTFTVAGARANLLTQEVIDLLKSMGVVSVGLGLESASPRILKFLKGDQVTIHDNRRAVLRAQMNDLHVFGYFILGTPGETNEDISQTYLFAEEYLKGEFLVGLLAPYPGTPLWSYASSEGLVHPHMDFARLKANAKLDLRNAVLLNEEMDIRDLKRWLRAFRNLQQREGARRFGHRFLKRPKDMAKKIILHPARATKSFLASCKSTHLFRHDEAI